MYLKYIYRQLISRSREAEHRQCVIFLAVLVLNHPLLVETKTV